MLIFLINLARMAMVVWIIYALLLIFAPQFLGRLPDPYGGGLQAVIAFGIGWCLDRALGIVRRREAERQEAAATGPAGSTGPVSAAGERGEPPESRPEI
jgi:hypothetical protein